MKKGDKDFSAAVTQVKGASPDAVFYGGYYAEAAPFVQQLRDGGFKGTFVSADGTKDPQFVKQAGEASKDAILSCPCGPATGDVRRRVQEEVQQRRRAPTAPRATTWARSCSRASTPARSPGPTLLDFVRNYNGQGVARNYQWTATGELDRPP